MVAGSGRRPADATETLPKIIIAIIINFFIASSLEIKTAK
jgi:hypothetical protein